MLEINKAFLFLLHIFCAAFAIFSHWHFEMKSWQNKCNEGRSDIPMYNWRRI